jgi:ABC-type antimicrobial peptide transport system permease subunit
VHQPRETCSSRARFGRRAELSLRSALGARRRDLVRQLLTESLLLALAGGAAGLALSAAGVRLLVALGPARLPRAAGIGIDSPWSPSTSRSRSARAS